MTMLLTCAHITAQHSLRHNPLKLLTRTWSRYSYHSHSKTSSDSNSYNLFSLPFSVTRL